MDGGCACGAVRYRISGTPNRTTNCHCEHCRRTSGAPFLTWIEIESSKFTIVKGAPSQYESRPEVVRRFCASCIETGPSISSSYSKLSGREPR